MKQNASVDASFWINSCSANIIEFLPDYFQLYATSVVAKEVRYLLDELQIKAHSTTVFNRFVDVGLIILQDPLRSIDWFQAGKNAAIGLSVEQGYCLLIDDFNPYHRAKLYGISVIGSADIIALLFEQKKITYEEATVAIKQTNVSKKQKRIGMRLVELILREKRTEI